MQPDLVQTAASPESEEGTPSQPQLQVPHQSPQPDEQSLPDLDFQMNCCCGVKGDRNLLYRVRQSSAMNVKIGHILHANVMDEQAYWLPEIHLYVISVISAFSNQYSIRNSVYLQESKSFMVDR